MEFWHFLIMLPFIWLIKWPFLHIMMKGENNASETTPESDEQISPIMILGMLVWLFILWLLWPVLPWSS